MNFRLAPASCPRTFELTQILTVDLATQASTMYHADKNGPTFARGGEGDNRAPSERRRYRLVFHSQARIHSVRVSGCLGYSERECLMPTTNEWHRERHLPSQPAQVIPGAFSNVDGEINWSVSDVR